jgi:hypothetical protein
MKKLWVGFFFFILFTLNAIAQGQQTPVSYDKIQKPYIDMTSLYTKVPKNTVAISDLENFPRMSEADWIFKAEGIPFGKVKFVPPFPLFVYKSSNGFNEAALLIGGNTWLVYRRWF